MSGHVKAHESGRSKPLPYRYREYVEHWVGECLGAPENHSWVIEIRKSAQGFNGSSVAIRKFLPGERPEAYGGGIVGANIPNAAKSNF